MIEIKTNGGNLEHLWWRKMRSLTLLKNLKISKKK